MPFYEETYFYKKELFFLQKRSISPYKRGHRLRFSMRKPPGLGRKRKEKRGKGQRLRLRPV